MSAYDTIYERDGQHVNSSYNNYWSSIYAGVLRIPLFNLVEYYNGLREFFAFIVKKQSEHIVFKRIK